MSLVVAALMAVTSVAGLSFGGAGFYVLYDYGFYVLGSPFNVFFLPYVLLVTLSIYAIVGIVVSVDARAVRERLDRVVPGRIVGGFLVAVAALFIALWTALIVTTLASATPVDPIAHVVWILDLTIQLPALLIGGVLLWR